MSVRMRHTHAHTANRRSHHALKEVQFTNCEKCKTAILRHTACTNCGMYRGRQVVDVATKLKKTEEKRKKREAEAKGVSLPKTSKKKAEAKKEEEHGKTTAAKPKRSGGMFRRSSTARAGEAS